jgi:hypothetical protein
MHLRQPWLRCIMLYWLRPAPPGALACLILSCCIARHSGLWCTALHRLVMHLFRTHFVCLFVCFHCSLTQRALHSGMHCTSSVTRPLGLGLVSLSFLHRTSFRSQIVSSVSCAPSGCGWSHSELMLRAPFWAALYWLGRMPSWAVACLILT